MEGQLADASIGEVCRGLASADATGTLHVEGSGGEAALKFREGRLVAVKAPGTPARIGDRLVHAGLLDRDDLERVLRDQQDHGGDAEFLGDLLVSDGLIDEDTVRVFLQEQVLDALVDILGWSEGRYHFSRHEIRVRPVVVNLDIDRALPEATRRILESRRVERHLPSNDAHVVAIEDVDPVDLEPEEQAVLSAFVQGNTIEGAAVRLGFGVRDTARIAWGLRLLGLVDVQPAARPTREPVPEPAPAPEAAEPPAPERAAWDTDEEDEEEDPVADDDAELDEQDILDRVRVDADADLPTKPRRRRLFGRSD